MKRGQIILIVGGGLLVAGIIVAAVAGGQFASSFLPGITALNNVALGPGESVDATLQVTDPSRRVSVAINVDKFGGPAGDVKLNQVVKAPDGSVVSSTSEFSENLFTTFQPDATGQPRFSGNYVLTVTNVGTREVNLNIAFGYLPFTDGMEDAGLFGGIIAGASLAAAGVITLIAGAVIVVIDGRKKTSQPPAPG
jgi:hypothetical protein